MDIEKLDDLRELIGEYWCLAFAEGKEGRYTDTPDGAAQKCLSAIESIICEARIALTPHEGYVLVPVEMTKEIGDVLDESIKHRYSAESAWDLVIHAVRQEVL